MIPVLNPTMKAQLEKVEDLVKAEVNVKSLEYITETEGVIKKKVKANFKTLGTRMGAKMKAVSAAITNMSQHDISKIESEGQLNLSIGEESVDITLADVEIIAEDIPGWSVASKGSLTVALDITLTEDLRNEGIARELVNRIQNIRKEAGFALTDHILVKIIDTPALIPAIEKYKEYICREILAEDLEWATEINHGNEIEVNEISILIEVLKK
jgi:isoleucyl-tRNA synthetase